MRPFVLASLLTLLAAVPTAASAQQPSSKPATPSRVGLPIVPGTRVRVTASTLVAPLIANFLEMRGDTAVFIENSSGRGIWTFTLDQITRLEQSAGEQNRNGDYMLKAGALGFGGGAALGLIFSSTVRPSDTSKRYSRLWTGLAGGAVGGAIGALIGSRFSREGWTRLPLPHRMSFAPHRRGGLDVGFDFSF